MVYDPLNIPPDLDVADTHLVDNTDSRELMVLEKERTSDKWISSSKLKSFKGCVLAVG